ncbi:MAG: hypothetical protein ISS15_00030 [Alphaproteobacteria bacterium]|nr:hypothetical protein [Alphaproteobacteria bacterium]MBL6937420.1 hypothetical protein [Alphaproteobacteria bacterium]MBL7096018.1 hypothetical protein [Alphaproteobacteria bacterium]
MTVPETIPPPRDPDDEIRRLATKHLAANVKIGAGLVAHCRQLAHDAGNGDHLGPLGAAARLINSNARMAHALGMIALVERRSRTIIQHIQPPKPELNSEKQIRTRAQMREDIGRKLDEAISIERRERLKQPANPQEEANLMLEEELWAEQHPKERAIDHYRMLGRAMNPTRRRD